MIPNLLRDIRNGRIVLTMAFTSSLNHVETQVEFSFRSRFTMVINKTDITDGCFRITILLQIQRI